MKNALVKQAPCQQGGRKVGFVKKMDIEDCYAMEPDELRRLVCQYKVVVIHQPTVELKKYKALMCALGSPVRHVLQEYAVAGYPDIIKISNLYQNDQPVGVHEGGNYWHTDMTYTSENTVFTALAAGQVPARPRCGGTEFIDCTQAYKILKERDKRPVLDIEHNVDLETAIVRHQFGNREVYRNEKAATQPLSESQANELPESVSHPLVIQHPITGGTSIYGVSATSYKIEGMPKTASLKVLDTLFDFVVEHSRPYVHYYQRGDIVIWDNLQVMHRGQALKKSNSLKDHRLLFRINVNYMETC